MKDDTQTPEPLLNAIRAEAATLELNTQPEPEPAPDSGLDTEDLLTENPRLPIRKSYHFQEFMPLEGEAFVRSAFLCILQREPDSSGLKTYLEQLHKGEKKPFILEALARSKEGAPYGIRIRGLFIYRLFLRLQRIPLIRPLASFLFTLYLRICSRLSADDLNLLHARIMQHLSNTDRRTRLLQAQQETLIEIVGHLQEYQTAYNAPKLEQALANINHKLAYQQQQWARLHSTTPAEQAPDITPAPRIDEDNTDISAFYVAFEDACRGTREEIRAKLEPWLEQLPSPRHQSNRVLDIGCGRGEWLQLLQENGYDATGIDTNPVMVSSCKEQKLNALNTDALEWLRQQPDASLCAITAFHVIEHIPFDQLLRWTTEARRVLQPGGVLIYETPNPENILVGSHTFYHDPTHRNPITPALLEFLAEYCGYSNNKLVRLHPYPEEARVSGNDPLTERVNGHLCGPQDIALVAHVPESNATKTQAENA